LVIFLILLYHHKRTNGDKYGGEVKAAAYEGNGLLTYAKKNKKDFYKGGFSKNVRLGDGVLAWYEIIL
jgi:hypothetical protein